ncbi:MAG: YidC/Oxa1 family membrane protein insertase [Patescibacteria group bacterium]|nr:YidC/Oxa1 family membrane protein insertase [Patescibacteria group bacterium]
MFGPIELLWTEFLYKPIYNLVVLTYNLTPGPNLGWAIISLAILIRIVFLYFSLRGFRTDEILEEVTPQVKKIEEEYKYNPTERRRKISELLRGKEIDPNAEIYAVLAQFIFLIVLYQVLQMGIHPEGFKLLYNFVPHPATINALFYGTDLSRPSILWSGIASFMFFVELIWEYETKKNISRVRFSEKWFPLLFAIFTFILLIILPSAKALFLFISVVFSMLLRVTVGFGRRAVKSRFA